MGSGLPNVPANAVAIDPLEPDRIFVGTDVGVYESADGGDTFVPFSLGLPLGMVVTDLEIDDSPHVLVAGTYGRGAFRVNLAAGHQPAAHRRLRARGERPDRHLHGPVHRRGRSIASWLWNFGDGASSTQQNPVRTYAAAGTYSVALTVTDDDGASGSSHEAGDGRRVAAATGTIYTGTIATQGSTQIQPNGTWYQSTVAGHPCRAASTGPAGTDFDLYLDRWNGSTWVQVARQRRLHVGGEDHLRGHRRLLPLARPGVFGHRRLSFQLQRP